MCVTSLVHTDLMNTTDDPTGAVRDGEHCSECRGPVVPIVYGFPGPDMFEAANRGDIVLGGCTLFPDSPTHSCACGATTSGVLGDDDLLAFDIDDARSYIASVRWQFAKKMSQWPHEYTVSDWRPELREAFLDFVRLIRTDGVVKPWPADSPTPRYHHTYLEIDGWDYWTMDDRVDDTELINRARIDEGR